MATCSIRLRVEISSVNTAPPALMTNTLFLYIRMYGAALFKARTAIEGSGRLIIIANSSSNGRSGQHAVQDGHLHRQTIEGLELDHGTRAVEHLVGHRDVWAHRQAMHQLGLGPRAGETRFPNAPVSKIRPQARIGFRIAVVLGRSPFLGVQHACFA